MANTYVTAAELQNALPVSDPNDIPLLNIAISGASRGIDSYCGQKFWQDDSAVAREYFARNSSLCLVDPISTTTGLVVKTDSAGDGTYATTLTITTDFLLFPVNAAFEIPAAPYTQIWLPTLTFPTTVSGRPNVQVTAKFGWPSVPDDVHAAALLIARDLYKEMKDAPFGVAGVADLGVMRIRQNATARMLLNRYRKPLVA